jgi:hypothetical protein
VTRHLTPEGLERLRAARRRTRQRALEQCREVCNQPFRTRYLELRACDGVTPGELALHMGWKTKDRRGTVVGDHARLHRALGLMSRAPDRRGVTTERYYQQTLRYETALKMADLLGMDPVDAGL